ncbi:MAG TPA: PAS domain S-box protein [Burkholderiaceae bacterium]|nr:PAS domain S-box protein [Burkholderiaceae bacterium]
MSHPESVLPTDSALPVQPLAWGRHWWRRQTPTRQDRFAVLAPLASVLLFFAAIATAFWYLRVEEIDREQEAVKRDVEYAQQQVRLRLLERQEQLMLLARDVANREINADDFTGRAESLVAQYPELQSITWINERRRVIASQQAPSFPTAQKRLTGEVLRVGDTEATYSLARDLRQPVYSQPTASSDFSDTLQLHVPMFDLAKFSGVVLAEYSLDGLLRYGIPSEVSAKYAVSLLDGKGALLAGSVVPPRNPATTLVPWATRPNEYEVPVSPVGNGLIIRAQAYRTSLGLIGSGLFWLVSALSVMTAWMLIVTWRHTRRRMQAQQALVQETNFRRAMENSMLTGMRALDLQGRITYVNAAFCQMTGWGEAELVGRTAPFPYWPDADRESLAARLDDELHGRTTPGGFQVRVKRKDGTLFDARLYVSPLIDAKGQQTGWMTSMTDITEPNRIREQLSASYERFTIVLESLDASVSVAPLGSDELVFANKLYRLWFGVQAAGHLQLVMEAGVPAKPANDESHDAVDSLAGLPADSVTGTQSESAEIFVPELGKWLEVRSRYLSWVDGRLAQMVIATDITPRRRAEEQAFAQAERAQTASRLITMGEMASSVAHELNQPLTAINNYCNGMVSRIKGGQISEEDLLTALEKTGHQAQRAGQIILRIRSFVKRSEPNRTLSDVTFMVNEAVELAEIELRRRNVRLSHYVASRLPPLLVDPILIEQVLVNLLKNATEAIDLAQRPSAQRSVELRVVPKETDGLGVVEFSVTDTGKGLAPEVMERLYEAFFSTKAEGMGIGLNLCRTIVESHQGRMKAENLYNGADVAGCRFSFWIPLVKPAGDTANPDLTNKNAGVTA